MAIELAPGRELLPIVGRDGALIGYVEQHPSARNGSPCGGSIAISGTFWAGDHPRWRAVSVEPLTLEPSVLCRTCGNHGWVRDGRWVPA